MCIATDNYNQDPLCAVVILYSIIIFLGENCVVLCHTEIFMRSILFSFLTLGILLFFYILVHINIP